MAKKLIGDEMITIPAAQFARILAQAVYSDFLSGHRTKCEARIANMRKELMILHGKMGERKTASDETKEGGAK